MSWIKSFTAAAIAAAAAATPASALVTFGSSSIATAPNIRYIQGASQPGRLISTNGQQNTLGSPLVVFSVTDTVANSLPLAATVARLTLDAVVPSTSGLSPASPFSIGGISGTFSIIALSPVTLGSVTSDVLLTATFSGATLAGVIGSSSIVFSGNNTTGSVVFSSDFLIFDDVIEQAFSFTGNTTSPLGLTGAANRLASFRSSVAGTYASDPAPTVLVPEPATWAMLVIGFGLVGVSVRRRRNAVVA